MADGILENNAFKHNTGDMHNETWTQLLLDFGFFDDQENHIMDLRRRFVLGAADWCAGNNGSLRNDKEILGYTDTQREYIWNTMLVDGAWAVPGITDAEGNVIKENDAPELLIKFIAHDLRCHIIVFDLVLDRIQFISGNHLKQNNVVFESPLLLYATGSHFQSVFQYDHEFFINLAKELETANSPVSNQSETSMSGQAGTGCSMEVGTEPIRVTNTGKQMDAGEGSSNIFAKGPGLPSYSVSSRDANVESCKEGRKGSSMADRKVPIGEKSNREACNELSNTRAANDNDEDEQFERVKKMKKKDRSPSEQKLFDRVRMKRQRQRETPEVSAQRRVNDKEYKRNKKEMETATEAAKRKEQAKEYMRSKRTIETATEAALIKP